MDTYPVRMVVLAVLLTWPPGTRTDEGARHGLCFLDTIVLDRNQAVFLDTNNLPTGRAECSVEVRHAETYLSQYTVFSLTVLSFDLAGQDPCDPHQEHLKITFGESSSNETTIVWCGGSYAPVLETRQNLRLTYVFGQGQRGRGFNISLSLVRSFCRWNPLSFVVDAEPKYLYSPGYPNSYSLSTECEWNVVPAHGRELLIDSLTFHLETHARCNYDHLSVNDVKYCGDQRVYITSNRRPTQVRFQSDHTNIFEGFVIKLVELPEDIPECRSTVVATTAPTTLRLPSIDTGWGSINCWWLLDAGQDDRVVLLDTKHFYTTAACGDFSLALYDGMNADSQQILRGCAPQQMFQTVRSSGRYLYLEADVSGFSGVLSVNVEFTLTSSLKAAPPRVLYAGFADSHVFLDSTAADSLGMLLRGWEDSPENYTTCIRLSVSGHQQETSGTISDYIFAYSGWNETFMELGTACGRQAGKSVVSHGSKIFVQPKQPSSSWLRYKIWLVYRLQRFCRPNAVGLQATSSVKRISSDIVPSTGHYPNNAYCRWLISPLDMETAKVKVLRADLFPDYCRDNITVYEYDRDGTERQLTSLCDEDLSTVMGSVDEKLLLEFTSNYRLTASGFSLQYSSVSLRDDCPAMAAILVQSELAQVLTSPNYPNSYPNNLDCKWRITAREGVLEIKLQNMSIDGQAQNCAQHDYLVIYDGPDTSGPVLQDVCGSSFPRDAVISTSSSVLVHFHSDDAVTASGFLMEIRATESVDRFRCNKNLYVMDGEFQYITSPYYPNPYPRDTSCYWQVSAAVGRVVVLEVMDVDLPMCQDSVKVYDGATAQSPLLGRVCKVNNFVRLTSSQQFMYITFTSTTIGSYAGFRFRLRSGEESLLCDGRVLTLMAYPNVNYFTSPNYPRKYPPTANCQWRIESVYNNMTVRIDVEDALLESSFTCNFDSINIYDGHDEGATRLARICGEHTGTYYSSSKFMYVQFQSDASSEYRGFRIGYRAVSSQQIPEYSGSQKSGDNTGVVVGGVLGAAVVLLVGFTLFFCFLKHSRRHPAQHSSPCSRHRSRHGSERNGSVYFMSPVIVNQLAPPCYPGLANHGFEDSPLAIQHTAFTAPPSYAELEAPPPYSDAMIFSHPPSSPGVRTEGEEVAGFNLSRAGVPPEFKPLETSHSAPLGAEPEARLILFPRGRHGQLPARVAAASAASHQASGHTSPKEHSGNSCHGQSLLASVSNSQTPTGQTGTHRPATLSGSGRQGTSSRQSCSQPQVCRPPTASSTQLPSPQHGQYPAPTEHGQYPAPTEHGPYPAPTEHGQHAQATSRQPSHSQPAPTAGSRSVSHDQVFHPRPEPASTSSLPRVSGPQSSASPRSWSEQVSDVPPATGQTQPGMDLDSDGASFV